MKVPPIGPIGGPFQGLSPKALDRIARIFPDLPEEVINRINREAGFYVLYRDSAQPRFADVRDELLRIKRMVLELHDVLCSASPTVRRLVDQGAIAANMEPNLLDALGGAAPPALSLDESTPALVGTLRAVARAERNVPTGRAISAHEYLVSNLARVLQAAGVTADWRPNGPMVRLVGIILSDLGEKRPKDIRKLVQRTLDNSPV